MPAGKIRAADVADFAGGHQVIEGAERLFDRRGGVEAVELKHIEVVGAEAAQGAVHGPEQGVARGADLVGGRTVAEGRFGGDQHLVAAGLDGRAENLLGGPVRVNIRRVEQVHPGVEAAIDQAFRLGDFGVAPRRKQLAAPAERARAQG